MNAQSGYTSEHLHDLIRAERMATACKLITLYMVSRKHLTTQLVGGLQQQKTTLGSTPVRTGI